MKKYMNQKGFTLVEVLVVIAIVAILFVVLVPQIDSAMQKSRMNNVRSDFRNYQQSTHSYFLRTMGEDFSVESYNRYLDASLGFDETTRLTSIKDPWGNPYELKEIKERKIVIRSKGPDESWVEDSGKEDDFLMAMYFYEQIVDECTMGFDTNNHELTIVPLAPGGTCGDDPI